MEATLNPGMAILIMKPKMTRSFFELTRGEENIGSITFPKPFGTLAEVKLFEEEWSLKRMGFWKPLIGSYGLIMHGWNEAAAATAVIS